MARKRKYEQGVPIRTLDELQWALNTRCWFWLRGRPKHPAIIESMTLRTLLAFIRSSVLFLAKEVNEA